MLQSSRLRLVLLVATLVAVGCGGNGAPSADSESPADAAIRLDRLLSHDGYAAFYDEMHPALASYISKDAFLHCGDEQRAGIQPHQYDDASVLNVRDLADAVFVRETLIPVADEPKAINVRLFAADQRTDVVRFVARSGGKWRWYLLQNAVNAYRAGGCPGAQP